MARSLAGSEIERLIQLLGKLPGLGPRSARRAALHLIKKRETLMVPLTNALEQAAAHITTCTNCGNIDTHNPCMICQDTRRDPKILIIVEDVADLWALERANVMSAFYHVLGGTLSALDGVRPEDLNVATLVQRVSEFQIEEVILAVNATVDGQTTAHYLTDMLETTGVKITRLAHGVPLGGELDYLDDGTLATALRSRSKF
jgi:recombination protein RecR